MHYLNCDNKIFIYEKHKKTLRSVCDAQFYENVEKCNGINDSSEIKLVP